MKPLMRGLLSILSVLPGVAIAAAGTGDIISDLACSDLFAALDAISQYEWVKTDDGYERILTDVNMDGCANSDVATSGAVSLNAITQYVWAKQGDGYVNILESVNEDGCAVSDVGACASIAINANAAACMPNTQDGFVTLAYNSAWKKNAATRLSVYWINPRGERVEIETFDVPCAGEIVVDASDGRQGYRKVGVDWLDESGNVLDKIEREVYSAKETISECVCSSAIKVDAFVGRSEPIMVTGRLDVVCSTQWDAGASKAKAVLSDGKTDSPFALVDRPNATTVDECDLEALPDGAYRAKHTVNSTEGGLLSAMTADIVRYDPQQVAVHSGEVISSNETWGNDRVHVVYGEVVVTNESVLTIAPMTVVKFVSGSGIAVSEGATCFAIGAIFTHVNDDTVGGDTRADKDDRIAVNGGYHFSGDLIDDGTTEYRYVEPVEISGTISADQILEGHTVYSVTGNVTVPANVELVIRPGAVVKLAAGCGIDVKKGGRLIANGTKSSPIIFTSEKDDAHGGDTNGDGADTSPEPGDWTKITVRGEASFNYAELLYGSHGSGTDDIIMIDGGNVVLNNSRLEHGQMYAIGLETGHLYMTNSIIADFFCAYRHWPSDPIVNSIICDCSRLSNNNGQHFANCVVYGISEAWDWSGGSGNTYDHCVVFNPADYALQSESIRLGDDGSRWADPRFEDFRQFKLKSDSPCIDAGNGDKAPQRDRWNFKRANINGIERTGVADASGNYPDIGIFEYQPRTVASDIDFEITSVEAPKELVIGEPFEVKWSIVNNGSAYVKDLWRDVIEFVSENGTVTELAVVSQSGGLAADGTRSFVKVVKMPSVAGLRGHVRVTVNKLRDIYEGYQTENNRLMAAESVVAAPILTMGIQSPTRKVVGKQSEIAYRLSIPEKIKGGLVFEAFYGKIASIAVRYGEMPSPGMNDCVAIRMPSGKWLLEVDATKGEPYLSVQFSEVGETTELTSLFVESPTILEVSRTEIPSVGKSSIEVYGCRVGEMDSCALKSASDLVGATAIRKSSWGEAVVGFDLDWVTCGDYVLKGVVGGVAVQCPVGIKVVEVEGQEEPRLKLAISGPSSVRAMRWYDVVSSVINDTDFDIDVPILVLKSGDVVFRDPDDDVSVSTNIIQLLPLSKSGDPKVVAAHSTNVIHVSAMMGLDGDSLGIVGRLVPFGEAKWDTVISQGTYEDKEWDEYFYGVTNGYASVGEYLAGMAEMASGFCHNDFIPQNLFRLFNLQAERNAGSEFSFVSGYLLDGETGAPVKGEHFSLTTTNSEGRVSTVTDENGFFAAYGVPVGPLEVLSEGGCVHSRESYEVTLDGLAGVILLKSPMVELTDEPMPEVPVFKVYENLKLVTAANQSYVVWKEGAGLALRRLDQSAADQTVDFGIHLNEFDCKGLDNGRFVLCGVGERSEGTNVIYIAELAHAGEAWTVGAFREIERHSRISFLKIRSVTDQTVVVDYYRANKTGMRGDYCRRTIDRGTLTSAASLLKRSTAKAKLLGADGEIVVQSIPGYVGSALESVGFDVSGLLSPPVRCAVQTSVSDSCCKHVAKKGIQGSISAEVKGVDVEISLESASESVSRCSRYFSPNGDCQPIHYQTEWSQDRFDGTAKLSVGASLDYLGTYQGEKGKKPYLGGVWYKAAKLIPLNLDIGWSAGPSIRFSSMRWTRNSSNSSECMDYSSQLIEYAANGEAHACLQLGYGETAGGGGKGHTKREFGATMDVGLNLQGSLTANITLTRDNHGNGKWDSTGTISGEFNALGVTANASWTRSGNDWIYNCSVSGELKDIKPTVLKSVQSTRTMAASRVSSVGEDDVVLVQNAGSVSATSDGLCVFCREYEDDEGVMRSGLFVQSPSFGLSRMVSASLNVMQVDVVSANGEDLKVVFSAARKSDSKDPADILASIFDKHLYLVSYSDGEWGEPREIVALGRDDQVGAFVVAHDSTSDGSAVLYERISCDGTNETSVVKSLECLSIEPDGQVNYLGTVVNATEQPVHALDVTKKEGLVSLVYSAGPDGVDDKLYHATYEGQWNTVEVNQPELVARSAQREMALAPVAAVQSSVTLALPRLLAKTGPCCRGDCSCPCEKSRPRPSMGCGCGRNCKQCNGDCKRSCDCKSDDDEKIKPDPEKKKSIDPNEISGPVGVGEGRFVNAGEWLDLTIYFENKSIATAAAQEIRIDLPKDPWLDWNTFELGEVALGSSVDLGLVGKRAGACLMALSDETFGAKTEVKLDEKLVSWYLRAWDPATIDNFPDDAYAGILPPNDPSTHCGEGHVTYRVKVRDDAPDRTIVTNEATIVFDYNEAIVTEPNWWNTVGEVIDVEVEGVVGSLKFVVGEKFGTLPEPAARAHYRFLGWYSGRDGSGDRFENDSIVPSGLTAIYQHWELIRHEVYVDGVLRMCVDGEELLLETFNCITNGSTNVVCLGWSGTGDFPKSGTGTNTVATITQPSSLDWHYLTNFLVRVDADAGGEVMVCGEIMGSGLERWLPLGANIAISAVADAIHRFVGWCDVISGDAVTVESNFVHVLYAPISLKAVFDAKSISEVIASDVSPRLNWSFGGAAGWYTVCDETARLGGCVRNGEMPDSTNCWMEAMMPGRGVLKFKWKASCENRYDYAVVYVNGVQKGKVTGETGWQTVSLDIDAPGSVVRWSYVKGRSGHDGCDCVFIDDVSWQEYAPPTLAEALDATNLTWSTYGDSRWAVKESSGADGRECAVSAEIGDCGVSGIETFVYGPGQLTFAWKASCEDGYDFLDFYIDDVWHDGLTGVNDWSEISVNIAEGRHVLRWEYWKDEIDLDEVGDDCAGLDIVKWRPVAEPITKTTEVPVPYEWIYQQGVVLKSSELASYIFENAGSSIGANGVPVWQSYVAGLTPTNADSKFNVDIQMVDGNPVILWTPALNGDGVREGVRRYRTFGSTDLKNWTEYLEGDESKYNFFKVSVEMP